MKIMTRSVTALACLALVPSAVRIPSLFAQAGKPVLRTVMDVPMPGPPVRFDYQSLDPTTGRLYISHMNADQLVVFETKKHLTAEARSTQRVTHCASSSLSQPLAAPTPFGCGMDSCGRPAHISSTAHQLFRRRDSNMYRPEEILKTAQPLS